MNINDTRSKLKNIIDGVIIEGATDNCTATRNILCSSFSTSTTVKRDFESKAIAKEEQVEFLKRYAQQTGFWVRDYYIKCVREKFFNFKLTAQYGKATL